jgi:putative proteasome-type protease
LIFIAHLERVALEIQKNQDSLTNISVGPPVELRIYRKDSLQLGEYLKLCPDLPYYQQLQQNWQEGLRRSFAELPRFAWEASAAAER